MDMIKPRIKSSLQVIVPWLLFLVVDVIKKPKQYIGDTFFLWYYLPGYIIWVAITIPVYKIFVWTGKFPIWKRVVFLVAFGLATGIFKVVLTQSFYLGSGVFFGKIPATSSFFQFIGGTFYLAEATIIAWVMLIVFYVIEISRKYQDQSLETSKLESALTQANLQALKMQIRPHFLFNAHNAIATLMRSDKNEEALEMLLKLSDLLRTSLNTFDSQLIPLDQEIAFAKKYLDIEMTRFEDRLEVEFEVGKEEERLFVPVFILQPLIENGIIHGVSKNLGLSKIKVCTSTKDDSLVIKTFNTGSLAANGSGPGIGLSNVRSRLDTLFKDEASLVLTEVENGVQASLTLPLLKTAKTNY
ncbi:MAG: histidine kinase [Cyclobacteriaceae bacterium]